MKAAEMFSMQRHVLTTLSASQGDQVFDGRATDDIFAVCVFGEEGTVVMEFRIFLEALLDKWIKLRDFEVEIHSLAVLTNRPANSMAPLLAQARMPSRGAHPLTHTPQTPPCMG